MEIALELHHIIIKQKFKLKY